VAAGRFVVCRSKIIGGLVWPAVFIGVVVPLEEPASLAATLTVANVTALQPLRQITVAVAEKELLQSGGSACLCCASGCEATHLPPSIGSGMNPIGGCPAGGHRTVRPLDRAAPCE